MLYLDLKGDFKNWCIKLEHLQNKLENIFDLKEKELLKKQMLNINKEIDKILDDYNKENKL